MLIPKFTQWNFSGIEISISSTTPNIPLKQVQVEYVEFFSSASNSSFFSVIFT